MKYILYIHIYIYIYIFFFLNLLFSLIHTLCSFTQVSIYYFNRTVLNTTKTFNSQQVTNRYSLTYVLYWTTTSYFVFNVFYKKNIVRRWLSVCWLSINNLRIHRWLSLLYKQFLDSINVISIGTVIIVFFSED